MTTETQVLHTPGPWHIREAWTPYVMAETQAIAAIVTGDNVPSGANASLIATAPELLAAAKNALEVLDNQRIAGRQPPSFINLDGARIMLIAAITKAGGDAS